MEWQPIETAPEASWILIYNHKLGTYDVGRKGGNGMCKNNWGLSGSRRHQPTHWMPLPEPPTKE